MFSVPSLVWYISAVQYLGCYLDRRERDLAGAWLRLEIDNTIEKCAEECKNLGKLSENQFHCPHVHAKSFHGMTLMRVVHHSKSPQRALHIRITTTFWDILPHTTTIKCAYIFQVTSSLGYNGDIIACVVMILVVMVRFQRQSVCCRVQGIGSRYVEGDWGIPSIQRDSNFLIKVAKVFPHIFCFTPKSITITI